MFNESYKQEQKFFIILFSCKQLKKNKRIIGHNSLLLRNHENSSCMDDFSKKS